MVSSIQIDSMFRFQNGITSWQKCLPAQKTIFPPSFESQSFLNRGNRYPSMLNCLSGKLVSSLVSSIQSICILDVEMISLK